MGKKDLVPDSSVSILLTLPEGTAVEPAVREFLANQFSNFQTIFFNKSGETVGIELVRQLKEHSSFARAKNEPQALVICDMHTATIPAQNALLKIVEEPPANTLLIFTVYPGHQLLPTLISRCREILWTTTEEGSDPQQSTEQPPELTTLIEFCQQPEKFSYHELIDLAEKIKNTNQPRQLIRNCLQQLASSETILPKNTQILLNTLEALEKNGNVRLVLEHGFFTIRRQTNTR